MRRAVCAVLAQLPPVQVVSRRPIELALGTSTTMLAAELPDAYAG